jgi:tetratricopeptide (TPR) repeat protein
MNERARLVRSEPDPRAVAAPSTAIESVCEGVIEAGWLAALVVVPLHFNPYSRQTFDPDKTTVLHAVVLVMAAAWLIKALAGGRLAASPPPARGDDGAWWRVPLVAPTVFLVLIRIVSAAASVDPYTSFAGSYARAQGVVTDLAYVSLFALVLAHLRTARQWRRIVFAVAITSFAVSSYAVLQRLGLDPVAWTRRELRVGSTLGNPIFLAGFLLFVIFLTAREVVERGRGRSRDGDGDGALAHDLPMFAILVYNLVLQVLAVVLAQSRGPVLGLLAGSFVGTLALLLRRRGPEPARRRAWSGLRRHAWLAPVAGMIVLLTLFAITSRPGTPAATRAQLPGVGRLVAPFDLSAGTGRLRVLIWRGAIDLLRDLGSHSDRGGSLARLLVGYGPETFAVVYPRYQPSEMVSLDNPNAMPDRAHNEPLDRLVMTGLLGFASWFWWWGALLLTALAGSHPHATPRRRLFWALLAAGALAGAVAPAWFGLPEVGCAGLTAGMIAGLVLFLAVTARDDSGETASARTVREALSIVLLATATAHLVEISLGIAVTATNVYLWFFASVLVATERRWLALDVPEPSADDETVPARASVIAGLLAGLAISTLLFAFLSNRGDSSSPTAVLAAALTGGDGIGFAGGALWLPLLAWLASAALAASLEPKRSPRSSGWIFFVATLATAGTYLVNQALRLSHGTSMRHAGRALPDLLEHIARHAAVYTVFVLCWTLVAGGALGIVLRRRASARTIGRAAALRAMAAAVVLLPVTTLAVGAALRRPIADSLVKNAAPFAAAGVADGFDVLRRAAALAPHEARFELEIGRTLVEAARSTKNDSNRVRWLSEARTALEAARSMAPLEPDHVANLARLAAVEAELASSEAEVRERFDAAAKSYESALALRPHWVTVMVEYAVTEHRLDRPQHAFDLLDRAIEIDPGDPNVHRAVAQLNLSEAAAARAAEDWAAERDHQTRADAALATANELDQRSRAKWLRRLDKAARNQRSLPERSSPD